MNILINNINTNTNTTNYNTNNCINCNKNKYMKIEYKYIKIINKHVNDSILFKLLDDIDYYTPLNYYNKQITKINKLFNQINILHNTFPQHIWSIIYLYTKSMYSILIDNLVLKLTLGLRTYQQQYYNQLHNWNNPSIQLYCNKCKYKNTKMDCHFCYTYDFTNMNGMCYNCFQDIFINTTN